MSKADEIRQQIAALESKLHEAEEAERREKGRSQALSDIAAIAAWKVLFARLKASDGVMGAMWHDIAQQAQPREKNLAKAYDISETELHNAIAKGREAVSGL